MVYYDNNNHSHRRNVLVTFFQNTFMQYLTKTKMKKSSNSRPAKNSEPTNDPVKIAYRINLFYVGGCQKTVLRLEALTGVWNGRFFSHDDDLVSSEPELVSAAIKADAVVFTAGCVSLSASKTKMSLQ
jgi:hypothetical protein